jgi:4a-hydroxytetrahydrobiopterin dehydratase
MPRFSPLSSTELDHELRSLPDWSVVDGRLHTVFQFTDFAAAFGFMASTAVIAAEMDHHPDWTNSYSKVVVDLVTHDAGGITRMDVELARRMSALAVTARRASLGSRV